MNFNLTNWKNHIINCDSLWFFYGATERSQFAIAMRNHRISSILECKTSAHEKRFIYLAIYFYCHSIVFFMTLANDLGAYVDNEFKFFKQIETQVNISNKLLGPIDHTLLWVHRYRSDEAVVCRYRAPAPEFEIAVWSPKLPNYKHLVQNV
jgi:hypothetical protein